MENLREAIGNLPVVDTHEHLMPEADFLVQKLDFSLIPTYTGLDLGQAGAWTGPWGTSQFVIFGDASVAEKWKLIADAWPKVNHTRFAMATRRALKRFFDVDDLDERTVHVVSDRMSEYQYEGVYRDIIQRECGIRVCLKIGGDCPERHYFAPVFYIDPMAGIVNHEELEAAFPDGEPATSEAFLSALDVRLEEAKAYGAVAIKIGWTARRRPLSFVEHPQAEVARSYEYLRSGNYSDYYESGVLERLKPFHDACYRRCFKWAGENDMPVQVHSGMEFDQPWDGRPSSLIPSLSEFRDTRFAILHGSYPHLAELTGLARGFHNVAIDMAWLSALSGPVAELWLDEWLDVLPDNKLMAFGGDCLTFFEVYSFLEMTRDMLARVLTKRVSESRCTEERALYVARLMLHDNPWEFYRLGDRWAPGEVG